MKATESDAPLPAHAGPQGREVQGMFAGIAHRYDFLNHFLSASIDRYWRKCAVEAVRRLTLTTPQPFCLDLCSGTGDLALDLYRRLRVKVVASDFCHPMLTRSRKKTLARGADAFIRTVEADALTLPFQDGAFDAVTVGFGLRNLEDLRRGLDEMCRILRPGGAVVVLEFSQPVMPVFRQVFQFYFRYVLPRLGAAISGDRHAYQYLPDSVRNFPSQENLVRLMEAAGFRDVGYRNLTGGVAALHWGTKP
jgi:demethylmenaquinone methyltransferase / 2-methoxy-6-polyprenyl-1,4-benzoquinol methylase